MQKQLEEPRSILMSSVDRAAHIDGNRYNYGAIHTRFRAEYKQRNKTDNRIYECLLGFCFNNIFCAAKILAASTVFCPIPETKK